MEQFSLEHIWDGAMQTSAQKNALYPSTSTSQACANLEPLKVIYGQRYYHGIMTPFRLFLAVINYG